MSFSICFLFRPISVVNSTFRWTILHSSILNSFFYSTKTARSMETMATTATAAVMCSFVLFQFSSCWFSMASDFNTCRNMKSFLFALCTWNFHQSNRVLFFHGDVVPKERKKSFIYYKCHEWKWHFFDKISFASILIPNGKTKRYFVSIWKFKPFSWNLIKFSSFNRMECDYIFNSLIKKHSVGHDVLVNRIRYAWKFRHFMISWCSQFAHYK